MARKVPDKPADEPNAEQAEPAEPAVDKHPRLLAKEIQQHTNQRIAQPAEGEAEGE